jgi:hypothetical protein
LVTIKYICNTSNHGFAKCFPETISIDLPLFYLVDNRVTPQRNNNFYDPAAWIKPIMQHANNVFKRYISPNRELSVDEALVGTKARFVMT